MRSMHMSKKKRDSISYVEPHGGQGEKAAVVADEGAAVAAREHAAHSDIVDTVDGTQAAQAAAVAMKRETRTGRLIRKLALIFLLFTAVAVALNCILTYISTRDTYLTTETDRLLQVGDYAKNSSQIALLPQYYSDWTQHADELDRNAQFDTEQQKLAELAGQINAIVAQAKAQNDDSAATQAHINALNDQYDDEAMKVQYYSFEAMLDRLRASFNVSNLSLLVPDESNESVSYIAQGAAPNQSRAKGDVHFFGDTEKRSKQDYPGLWSALDADTPSKVSYLSPDASTYSVYVPVKVGDASWAYEVSMGSDQLESAVWTQLRGTVIASCAVFAVCLIAMLLVLRRTLVKPLAALSIQVRKYAASKSVSVSADIRAGHYPKDEVGDLACNMAEMIDELQAHMDDIARMGVEREHARSELAVASRIQLSALPRVCPPFSGCDDFGLSASMRPAKEVGGDFYDFFLIDERHCGIVIADVSGKGIPAALFMMRAKALVNQLMREGVSPDQVLAQANNSLCEDNDAGMFVTVWLGVLDVKTGELRFANGGHNPPVYHHAQGQTEWVRDRSGLLLGSFEGVAYRLFTRRMAPGDSLILYTDGVTEAMDMSNHCYGDERLFHLVAQVKDKEPASISQYIEQDVAAFTQEADQADDITLVVLRYGANSGIAAEDEASGSVTGIEGSDGVVKVSTSDGVEVTSDSNGAGQAEN